MYPRVEQYFVADSASTEKWRERFATLGEGLKVGISWRGGKDESVRRARSTNFEQWLGLLNTSSAHFVNLQYGATEGELAEANRTTGVRVHHWSDSDPLRDLDDFAAQIAALDLVISVDNSTAHLAGALGKATWALLPFAADWRWLIDRDDSVWYRSVRLFRQERAGDWRPVFRRVKEALNRF
jgi:ADP-heptose:LPS heptosyltransferase